MPQGVERGGGKSEKRFRAISGTQILGSYPLPPSPRSKVSLEATLSAFHPPIGPQVHNTWVDTLRRLCRCGR